MNLGSSMLNKSKIVHLVEGQFYNGSIVPTNLVRIDKKLLFYSSLHGSEQWPSSSNGNEMEATTYPSWNYSVSTAIQLMSEVVMTTDQTVMNNSEWEMSDPLWTAIPMSVLYVLILVTGVIGNVLTCVVIVRNRYMHTATNYYLFSLAISDLLLLVLGLPQEIYQIWRRYPYAFGEVFCILRGFSSEASTNSSVLTITAFTMERYIAICHPLRAHTMSKLSRAIKLIVIIWFLGFVCAAPIAYQFGIVYENVMVPQSAVCNIKRFVPYLEEHIFALQSLIMFVLPISWISVLYILIGIKLRQSSQNAQPDLCKIRRRPIKRLRSVGSKNSFSTDGSIEADQSIHQKQPHYHSKRHGILMANESSFTQNQTKASEGVNCPHKFYEQEPNSQQQHQQHSCHQMSKCRRKMAKLKSSSTVSTVTSSSITTTTTTTSTSNSNSLAQRRAVIKMLTAVVAAFFICFAPFHAQRLMAIYVKNPSNYETVAFTSLTYISGVTYYLSATINPILYSIMSIRFRQAFHDTFVRTFCPSITDQFNQQRGRAASHTYVSTSYNHATKSPINNKFNNNAIRNKSLLHHRELGKNSKNNNNNNKRTEQLTNNGFTDNDKHNNNNLHKSIFQCKTSIKDSTDSGQDDSHVSIDDHSIVCMTPDEHNNTAINMAIENQTVMITMANNIK